MKIQWYPGHMKKTRKMIQESMKICDSLIEILDARAPFSSHNHNLEDLIKDKPHIILLSKSDLADGNITKLWIEEYLKFGKKVITVDKNGKNDVTNIKKAIEEIRKSQSKNKSMLTHRIMVVGIPNVGKSTLINRLAGKRITKVEDRPGVTRNGQWVNIGTGLQILDTPGILSPNFEDEAIAEKLAYLGTIKDNLLDLVEVASNFCKFLKDNYLKNLEERYKLNEINNLSGFEILEKTAQSRKLVLSRNELDLERIAFVVLDEFRSGKIGPISLEKP